MIRERQVRIVESHVEDARQRGARILAGGTRLPQFGPNYYAPTVLADVTHEMRIMREETFGPVLPIMSCADDDEAVRMANDSEFGLAASVWTRDRSRGEASGAAYSCRHGHGERCDFMLRHQRSSAWRREGQRCWTHPRALRAG